MIVSSTGTRDGMIYDGIQFRVLRHLLEKHSSPKYPSISEYHMGDCEGSDYQTGVIIHTISPKTKIHLHPPNSPNHRGFFGIDQVVVEHPEKPPLERNHDIVDALKGVGDYLVATPKGEEIVRSGTWATVRYAKKKHKQIYVIYPTGKVILHQFLTDKYTEYDVTPTYCPKCKSFNWKQVPDSEYPILECEDCKERWFSD